MGACWNACVMGSVYARRCVSFAKDWFSQCNSSGACDIFCACPNLYRSGKSFWIFQIVAAEFPKTPSPNPARIPPQTPPAGGKSVEAGRILSPRQIVSPCRVRIIRFNHLDFARNSFELCPTNTARCPSLNRSKKSF